MSVTSGQLAIARWAEGRSRAGEVMTIYAGVHKFTLIHVSLLENDHTLRGFTVDQKHEVNVDLSQVVAIEELVPEELEQPA